MTLSTSIPPTNTIPALQREIHALRSELQALHDTYHAVVSHLHQQLAEALQDPVTGLPTRRGWEPDARERLRHDRAAVALLDLDGFKRVNDTYGHAAGDRVLRVVADRLRHRLGATSLVGRAGGDEIVIVRNHPVPWDQVLHDLYRPIPVHIETTASVGASIGVATTSPGAELSTALRQADAAMYEAKRARLGWVHASPTA